MEIVRTHSADVQFRSLVEILDKELALRDGTEHAFYDQFNKLDKIKYVVLGFAGPHAICCGAIKEFEPGVMEVKRMFTHPEHRGKGSAVLVLKELEHWAKEMDYEKCILETGKKQPEAIALYKKCNYNQIPNYGQYAGMENSICFEKLL